MNAMQEPIQADVNNIYNFNPQGATADYYNNFAKSNKTNTQKPDLYDTIKDANRKMNTAGQLMDDIIGWLSHQIPPDAIVIEIAGGGQGQTRSGGAYMKFKNYYPLDISYDHIKAYTSHYNRQGFVCDAKALPFKDNSIDAIFTHTFLEHPLEPQQVLEEIARVLKPGGIIIHNDAWFVRWWHRFAVYGLKSWRSMTLREKLIAAAASVTEIKLFRLPPIIVRRFLRNLFVGGRNIPLRYKKLKPNYSLALACDEDAASNIDPVDVIMFYESRGFQTDQPLSFKERLLYPNKYIILRKIDSVRVKS